MATPADKTIRLNADVPVDMHFEFKKACLENRETMTDVLVKFIAKYNEITKGKKP